jgi:hypothetical protein
MPKAGAVISAELLLFQRGFDSAATDLESSNSDRFTRAAKTAGIRRSAAGELGHASIEARRLAQGNPLVSQKWAGSNSPGASGGSASFSRKHELWHVHTCHLPAAVSTVTRQGSALVFSTSRPQKQHGPNLTSIFPLRQGRPYVRNFTNCKTRD